MAAGWSGAVLVRGAPRAAVSQDFYPDELERAARDMPTSTVLVGVDSAGQLVPGALATAAARPAPHVAAASILLTRGPAGTLRLVMARELPPHAELVLWFHPDLAADLDLPFLTPTNIRGRKEYVCHECGACFEEPNPLKLHLFLRCAPAEPARLWRAVAARLTATQPVSAFRRVSPLPAPALSPPLPPPAAAEAAALAWAARLEAAATELGRGSRGHACLYCGKLYSRRYGLKIHLRTHTGYRPLRCRHCARAFGDPSNLNKHVRLHAGERALHACARCGKVLARRRDRERHQRTHCDQTASGANTCVS